MNNFNIQDDTTFNEITSFLDKIEEYLTIKTDKLSEIGNNTYGELRNYYFSLVPQL